MKKSRYMDLQRLRHESRERKREGVRSPVLKNPNKFQEDLGFMATEERAQEIRSATDPKLYKDAKSAYKKGHAALSKFEKDNILTIEQSYQNARKDFVSVNVVNNDNIEETYMLPKTIVDKMHSGTEAINAKSGSYTGKWHDGQYYVDVHRSGSDEAYGKELHEMVGNAERDVQTAFYDKYGDAITKGNTEAQASVDSARSELDGKWAEVQGDHDLTQDMLEDAANKYQETKAGATAAFSAMGHKGER